jgi:hypothetical protein
MNPRRKVVVGRRAQSSTHRSAIVAALGALGHGGPNIDVRRLQGTDPPRYRLRVRRYRAILVLDAETIFVDRVFDRRDAYH